MKLAPDNSFMPSRLRDFGNTVVFVVWALLLILAFGNAEAGEARALPGPSLVGIDHVPVAVTDLEEAVTSYSHLGFSIKPGRFHENGIRNSHIKFTDGSGVEFICPPSQVNDDLTRTYAEFLQGGEGPAYISFHARDTKALTTALSRANIQFKDRNGLLTLSDPNLEFIFFVKDNRSSTDKPEHFAHSNTAFAMSEVWLALNTPGRASLQKLLLALGAVETSETVLFPTETRAEVFTVQNGRVVVVSDAYELQKGRKIIGVKFRVQSLQDAERFLGTANTSVPPFTAHGLWFQFGELP